ncbi:uncharacterized protein [Blastocystis hominis]|uniref:Uncharacterized protein n=1 Tax=Blastocystis hominis TaxID=12968 RepID=D8M1D0_BLAHO|nr:uncharacterized protein [Blastocystis hominis]CBK21869.2 unnamed protein product [Blastocystis hominis]|eukprot:XP_012895917.1 uncharacterized protein [Blastocystis hominis]
MRRMERAVFVRVNTMWRRTMRPIRSVCFPARISFIKLAWMGGCERSGLVRSVNSI